MVVINVPDQDLENEYGCSNEQVIIGNLKCDGDCFNCKYRKPYSEIMFENYIKADAKEYFEHFVEWDDD